jgi:hypothetical protein
MKLGENAAACLFICMAMGCVMAWRVGTAKAQGTPVALSQNQVTAIDILLEPDATMLRHAEANNARLLKVFPQGFSLDATHRPHITLVQRFIRTADLERVYAAAHQVLAGANVNAMKLEAFKYYYAQAARSALRAFVLSPRRKFSNCKRTSLQPWLRIRSKPLRSVHSRRRRKTPPWIRC